MYSNTSNSYWKERQNKTNRSPLLAATLVVIALVAGTLLHRRYSTASLYNNDLLTQRRTVEQTTDTHWKQCESQVNSKNECTIICQPERNSIQRKTMHQACLHGCIQAHVTATTLSCRGKVSTEEELFQEIGGLAYIHCSKFQSTEPKPDVFATCRKYHRAGTKAGFQMGVNTMNNVLDEEWKDILIKKNSLSAEQ